MKSKPLSKTAQLRADRAQRKARRLAKKASDAQLLVELRARAHKLCSAPPASFQDWGVLRTQAFLKFASIVNAKADLKTITTARLADLVHRLETVNEWDLDYCYHVTTLSENAVDVAKPEENPLCSHP